MKKLVLVFISIFSLSAYSMTVDEISQCGAPSELIEKFQDDVGFKDYFSRIFQTTKDNQEFYDSDFEQAQSIMDAKANQFQNCQEVHDYILNVGTIIIQANQEMDAVKSRFEQKFREL